MATATRAATEPRSLAARQRPYTPYGSARTLWRSTAPEVIVAGPAGSGKSRSALEKLHACAEQCPGMRALIVRKTRESLSETALFTFEQKVVPADHPILTAITRNNRQHYHYPNGSEIVVGGLDKPNKIMSTEYDLIYAQEAIELAESEWEALTTRARNGVMPYQQLLGDTNPGQAQHWIKTRAARGDLLLLESRHEENPEYWDQRRGEWTPKGRGYIARLDKLTGVRKARLRHGLWASAEGVIYEEEWEPAVHHIDPFPIPADWPRFRAIDFGFINPFVCLWAALDYDDRLYIYRQLYHTQRIVARHAEQINALSEGEYIEATVADHDAEDRATLEAAGIYTVPARKLGRPGIEAVKRRLVPAGDGRPRFYVFRDSLVETDESLIEAGKPTELCGEMEVYQWAKTADGRPNKDEPLKMNDHACDSAGYLCTFLEEREGALNQGAPQAGITRDSAGWSPR